MKSFLSDIPSVLFLTGIGTDVGKSWATGWLAREMMQCGLSVITQKHIQTGNRGMSEDIELHRKIMGTGLIEADTSHITAPIILSYPASPHLAAAIDKVEVDFSIAARSTNLLLRDYDHVIIEGAGGLMVPLKENYLTLDYIREYSLPIVLVTNGALGSISHTLLNLAVISQSGLKLWGMIYNTHFDTDKIIAEETREYLRRYLAANFPEAHYIVMPPLQEISVRNDESDDRSNP